MPEYLAPGVYVEEIDTGNKPIEGVSTSTTGMVGVTERGPLNVPILLTSYGEYLRWFGEALSPGDFGQFCFLPYAVEGFFTNGGKRLYLTRVIDTAAALAADGQLFDRGDATSADTLILRAAGENTGTVGQPPSVYVLDVTDLSVSTAVAPFFIRVGDGSNAEYREVTAIRNAAQNTHVPLSFPLNLSHATGAANNVRQFPRVADPIFGAGYTLTLPGAAAGDQSITVNGAAADINALILAANPLLEIGNAGSGEHRFAGVVTRIDATTARVSLNGGGLAMAYVAAAGAPQPVTPLTVGGFTQTSTLTPNAAAGDRLIYVDNRNGNLDAQGDMVIVDDAAPPEAREARRIGLLATLPLSTGAYEDYPAGSLVERVTLGDDNRLLGPAPAAPNSIAIQDNLSFLRPGGRLTINLGQATEETLTILSTTAPNVVTFTAAPANAHNPGEPAIPDFSRKPLVAAVNQGGVVIALANRVSLAVNDVLRIGDVPNDEYVAIRALSNPAASGPDPGTVMLSHPLQRAHAAGTAVRRQNAPVPVAVPPAPTVLALAIPEASANLLVTDGTGYAAQSFLRVTNLNAETFFHRMPAASAAATPAEVVVDTPFTRAHDEGSPLVSRTPLIDVQALDVGAWGNRLRISIEDETRNPLVTRTTLQAVVDPNHIRLGSAAGVEPGTVLELLDAAGQPVGAPLKVDFINRQANFTLTLAGTGLDAAQQAAHAAAIAVNQNLGVRSREFRITVYLLHQPDPARPSRNDQIIDMEMFRQLSLDPRHSRYIHRIIGQINGPQRLADHRPEGESWYIRVNDLNPVQTVRLGPETLLDTLPTGQRRPARHRLERVAGFDSVGSLADGIFIGFDNINPEQRSGLFTLVNIDEVSIIAAPGRTEAAIQNALIDQCQNLRYRFAVLDGPAPPNDAIPNVQNLRQQFDTKYAAIYYPWLLLNDPYPRSLQDIGTFAIPPSGHVLGIYARTDIERGVHKSPANEVVRGIIGLQRTINKAEQEVLNPFPSNINVIRDFRPNNRAIRVWGGRVITSDPDWKYVNVRRLLIFIERSIDIGLQWVVFEPNAEPLWARVVSAITGFLTVVWRNGALEGTTREEAFFVKCDRTTMTQTDIDNGRLIVQIGVAPVKPAEFVIIRIGLFTAHAEE